MIRNVKRKTEIFLKSGDTLLVFYLPSVGAQRKVKVPALPRV